MESLNQSNEALRQKRTSVESQDDGLFEELEKSMELCQVMHSKRTSQWVTFFQAQLE